MRNTGKLLSALLALPACGAEEGPLPTAALPTMSGRVLDRTDGSPIAGLRRRWRIPQRSLRSRPFSRT